MYILAINCGSQTVKYKLYEDRKEDLSLLEQGEIKNIGFSGIKDHYQAIGEIMKRLGNYKGKIKAVGHRYVNGGTEFFEPEILDREKLKKL
ncbi:hypothetical protein KJ912_00020, partial [Patescibacteria group bacterium]|nr:hypothetical protein [Patescibacteria group bacterium]